MPLILKIMKNWYFAADAKKRGKEVVFTVVDILPEEEISRCRAICDHMDIPLKVRKYEEN